MLSVIMFGIYVILVTFTFLTLTIKLIEKYNEYKVQKLINNKNDPNHVWIEEGPWGDCRRCLRCGQDLYDIMDLYRLKLKSPKKFKIATSSTNKKIRIANKHYNCKEMRLKQLL